jgi:hypothetical protein
MTMTLTSLVRSCARRLPLAVGIAALGALALAGCSNKPVPPCPQVRVDSSTARQVKFQAGQDLTQIVYAVEMVGYDGQCKFSKEGVDVVMDLTFDIVAGPAANTGKVDVDYFVAIPQFFPKPEGKRVMRVTANMPKRAGARERITEKGVHAFIPLRKDEPGAAYDVYVGLQISEGEADYNRSRKK